MAAELPLSSRAMTLPSTDIEILPAWIDHNGHMNLGYYLVAFDLVTDHLYDRLGITQSYRERTAHTTFAAETHVTYDREAKLGDPLRVTSQIIDLDPKRLHLFHRMTHATEGYLISTNELMYLHIDTAGPRNAPWLEPVWSNLQAMHADHRNLPRPPQLGRVIGIRRKPA